MEILGSYLPQNCTTSFKPTTHLPPHSDALTVGYKEKAQHDMICLHFDSMAVLSPSPRLVSKHVQVVYIQVMTDAGAYMLCEIVRKEQQQWL